MAEIKLNKPLYKTDADGDSFKPTPRPPQASVFGRTAALFLDIMLLHLAMGLVTRFIPAIPLTLGPLAPWVGLLLGYAYFGFGFSHITLGRTAGKLITRVQVTDLSGMDISTRQAFVRAGLLLWPLPVHLLLRTISEYYGNRDVTSIFTTLEVFGTMLIAGWALGNLGFALFDPFRRTLYDRLAGTIIINAELEPEPVAEYLREARTAAALPPRKPSITSLGFAMTICLAFAASSAVSAMMVLRDASPDDIEQASAMISPVYGRAWPARPSDDNPTTGVLPATYQFRKRGYRDVEQIKADPEAHEALDRLIAATTGNPRFIDMLKEFLTSDSVDRMRRGEDLTSVPLKLRFELSFTEYADLFFAREAHPVYTLTKDVDMPESVTKILEETPADDQP